MNVEATTDAPLGTDADTIAAGVFEGEGLPQELGDDSLDGLLQSGEARAELGHLAVAHGWGKRIMLVGLGERQRLDPERARVAAAKAQGRARQLSARRLCWLLPDNGGDAIAAAIVQGTMLSAYRYSRFKPASERAVEELLISAQRELGDTVRAAAELTTAQNRARDLANAPANELTPTALAAYARDAAERVPGLSATVLDEDQIREAGMGAFAAVAQGSAQPAQLITLRYEGPGATGPLLALVGKAVTFDSGGLSLKPAAKMHEMKFDMAGGAAVIEAIIALAEAEAPVRVLALVGATENLPGATAIKPGDIVRAGDGTSIEINNTDAEGRLVLADCLLHARAQGADRLLDVATLTGGVVVALGSVYAGLMANDDDWARDGGAVRAGHRRGRLAAAAAPRLRADGQGTLRPADQPHREARGLDHHRRRVPASLRRRRAMGSPGHRRHGLRRPPALLPGQGRDRFRGAGCWPRSRGRAPARAAVRSG